MASTASIRLPPVTTTAANRINADAQTWLDEALPSLHKAWKVERELENKYQSYCARALAQHRTGAAILSPAEVEWYEKEEHASLSEKLTLPNGCAVPLGPHLVVRTAKRARFEGRKKVSRSKMNDEETMMDGRWNDLIESPPRLPPAPLCRRTGPIRRATHMPTRNTRTRSPSGTANREAGRRVGQASWPGGFGWPSSPAHRRRR